jgi:hypothetical protein
MNYWIFKAHSGENTAVLSAVPKDGPKHHKYDKGIPLLEDFPGLDDAVVCFDCNFPDDAKMQDMQECLARVPIFNDKVKSVFESMGANGEYLPIDIWDHQRQSIGQPYYIFNGFDKEDIIDMERSKVVMCRFSPDEVRRIKNLVIPDHFATDSHIFRMSKKPEDYVVSDAMKTALEEAGCTGCGFESTEGWGL